VLSNTGARNFVVYAQTAYRITVFTSFLDGRYYRIRVSERPFQ